MNGWKAGEAIGLITATAFALTVVYLHGYRTASDLDLFAYISLNDYFRIAVGWLVPVALGLVCALPIEAAIRRSEHGRSENEIMQAIAKGRHAGFWLAFRKGGLEFPFVVAALAVVVNTVLLLSGYAPRLWYYQNMVYASPVVWFAAVKRYEREKRLVTNWNATRRAWVWFFPAVLILSFFKGALTGEQAKVPPSNATSTRVFVVGRPSPIMGRVLFNVENYILLRTCAGGELEAIAKGQVSLIVEPSRQ